jgi:hypothetical protein
MKSIRSADTENCGGHFVVKKTDQRHSIREVVGEIIPHVENYRENAAMYNDLKKKLHGLSPSDPRLSAK